MDLNTIIERYQPKCNITYAKRITHAQRKAIGAVLTCHTERYGKMLLDCATCNHQQSRFHSCGHRSCPHCQHHDTTRWLERQSQKLLPVEYYRGVISEKSIIDDDGTFVTFRYLDSESGTMKTRREKGEFFLWVFAQQCQNNIATDPMAAKGGYSENRKHAPTYV